MKFAALYAALLLIAPSAFSAAVVQPPRNPFLADSNYSMGHANSAQTDSTVDPGPVGPTRQLRDDEMRYQDLGMFNLAYVISSPYKDGKRVVWTNGSQFMTKLDHDTFDIVATLRLPGEDHADVLTHERLLTALDAKSSFDEKWAVVQKSGYPPISGVYTLLDKDNQYVVAGKGFIRVYGDSTPGDRGQRRTAMQHPHLEAEPRNLGWYVPYRLSTGQALRLLQSQWLPGLLSFPMRRSLDLPALWCFDRRCCQ